MMRIEIILVSHPDRSFAIIRYEGDTPRYRYIHGEDVENASLVGDPGRDPWGKFP